MCHRINVNLTGRRGSNGLIHRSQIESVYSLIQHPRQTPLPLPPVPDGCIQEHLHCRGSQLEKSQDLFKSKLNFNLKPGESGEKKSPTDSQMSVTCCFLTDGDKIVSDCCFLGSVDAGNNQTGAYWKRGHVFMRLVVSRRSLIRLCMKIADRKKS